MTNRVHDVALDLAAEVKQTRTKLDALSEADSLKTRGPDTWSRKQILGHLIDSALNNVHRFVRGQTGNELVFPDYDQPLWVAAGDYQNRGWTELVDLWSSLNLHLARVIANIPDERLTLPCRIGKSEPMTLEFIVRDYVTHMRHHLEQINDPDASQGKTHPPFDKR